MGRPAPEREGVALVLVVILLLALQLLAHGSLVLARQELAASNAARRLLQARVAAEAGLGATVPLDGTSRDTVSPWAGIVVAEGALTGASHQTRVTRLTRELWLWEGWGRAERQPWRVGLGRVIWMMDPVERVKAFGGVIEVDAGAPLDIRGDVEADRLPPSRSPPDPRCEPLAAALDSVFADLAFPALAGDTTTGRTEPALGLLGPAELSERMATFAWVGGTPSPSETLGRCVVEDPWNWGDPIRPDRPCGSHWVTAWNPGGLLLTGGTGQGLLAVAGDLELAGTRFDGVLLVGGHLRLHAGAEVVGVVQAAGGATVEPDSRVRGSACAAALALEAARGAVGGPIAIPGGWIGPLDG
jgi:hypothetical protein